MLIASGSYQHVQWYILCSCSLSSVSVLSCLQPVLGDASGSAKESKDESKEQETSPSLQEAYPDLKKSKSR